MATLFAVYVAGRCVGRCDAKCYASNTPREFCHCVCCGDNHSIGLARALENTHTNATRWQRLWSLDHPKLATSAEFRVYHYEVITQTSFLPEMTFSTPIAI